MSRPRFLADNDLNDHIVDGVLRREPTIEFVRAREVGLTQGRDPDILDHAARHGYIVVSHDVNTMPGHARERIASGEHCNGLLMVHQWQPVGSVIDSLVLIWSASEAEEWRDVISFLPL